MIQPGSIVYRGARRGVVYRVSRGGNPEADCCRISWDNSYDGWERFLLSQVEEWCVDPKPYTYESPNGLTYYGLDALLETP